MATRALLETPEFILVENPFETEKPWAVTTVDWQLGGVNPLARFACQEDAEEFVRSLTTPDDDPDPLAWVEDSEWFEEMK